jgi:saccharopine dehydrogenase-like NADP-dependent oxidoreductase
MKALLLGLGLQGKAVVDDLEKSPIITEIIAADVNVEAASRYLTEKDYLKSRAIALDAADPNALNRLTADSGADIVISMLPPELGYHSARAALDAGIPYVSSNYPGQVTELDDEARQKGVTILPEMGMDPGIDLLLGRMAVDALGEVHGLYSYGAGIPEPACADANPLRYKITWTLEGVLKAYMRPARYLKDGQPQEIPSGQIFREPNVHTLEIDEIGPVEAYYNGDAVHYIDIFGLGKKVQDMGRFAFRWPGHCRFWSAMSDLGFLDDAPTGNETVSPRRFLVDHLTPRLQFEPHERDMVIVRVEAWGLKEGVKKKAVAQLIDYRDLTTGLFAMNRTVGYTAGIAARMILEGNFDRPGVLSPARDIPPEPVMEALKARGMDVRFSAETP